jgi:AcrR family transcriptional regulator
MVTKKTKKSADIFVRLFEAVSEKGWEAYSLPEMANDMGIPLSEFYARFPTKQDILRQFIQHITAKIMVDFAPSPSERETLFDVMMLRFEAMAPYKAGLARLYNETVGHATPTAPLMLPDLMQASEWMSGLAQNNETPYLIHLKPQKLLYTYLMAYKVWIRDDTPDLQFTLVEIDRRLDQIQGFQEFLKPLSNFFQR